MAGGLVLGICNGFQILLEAGLLPGAMLPNIGLSFICEDVWVKVENAETPFTRRYASGHVLRFPIAHAEGNYHTDPVTLNSPGPMPKSWSWEYCNGFQILLEAGLLPASHAAQIATPAFP